MQTSLASIWIMNSSILLKSFKIFNTKNILVENVHEVNVQKNHLRIKALMFIALSKYNRVTFKIECTLSIILENSVHKVDLFSECKYLKHNPHISTVYFWEYLSIFAYIYAHSRFQAHPYTSFKSLRYCWHSKVFDTS